MSPAAPLKLAQNLLKSVAAVMDEREMAAIEMGMLKTLQNSFQAECLAIYHVEPDATAEFGIALHDGRFITRESLLPASMLAAPARAATYALNGGRPNSRCLLRVMRDTPLGADEENLLLSLLRLYDNYVDVLQTSQRDHLTGLLNRNTFDQQLQRALDMIREKCSDRAGGNAADQQDPASFGEFWLGTLDIDHFKRINDGFGHLYGDEVLLLFAQILRKTLRKADLIYRFGGEEFVVIILVQDRAHAQQAFERLRNAIASYPFPQMQQVTASIGVVEIRADIAPVELLGYSDQALYRAKQSGRNQVCFHEDLAVPPLPLQQTQPNLTFF